MHGPSFATAVSDCILDNTVGVCDIKLIQYDAATLALKAQEPKISSHNRLTTQKKLYNLLQPQKCPIEECHGVLTGSCALVYPNNSTIPGDWFDLNAEPICSVRVAMYDLSCSFAISSAYKYALVLSRGSGFARNPLLESVLGPTTSLPWLLCVDDNNTEALVLVFNQKRQRKLWRHCLKDIFGYSTVNVHTMLSDVSERRKSIDATKLKAARRQSEMDVPRQRRRNSGSPSPLNCRRESQLGPIIMSKDDLELLNQNMCAAVRKDQPAVVNESTARVGEVKELMTGFRITSPSKAPKKGPKILVDTSKCGHKRTQSEPVALVANQSRTVSEMLTEQLSPAPSVKMEAATRRVRRKSTPGPAPGRFFAANVTPPLEMPPSLASSPSTQLSLRTPTPSPKKQSKRSSKLAVLLGHYYSSTSDEEYENLSELSVATASDIKSPELHIPTTNHHRTHKRTQSAPAVGSLGLGLVTLTPSTNTSTPVFQTLESWLTCQSLPSLTSDLTASSSTPSLAGLSEDSYLSICPSSAAGTPNLGNVPRWHVLSPPQSPTPLKYRLPEIPEMPEREHAKRR